MGRILLLCAFLLVLLSVASLMEVTEGRGRGGSRGGSSGSPRSLSGGTWVACVGSSLLGAGRRGHAPVGPSCVTQLGGDIRLAWTSLYVL
ncbi:hypothetical protein CFC21_036563 [Triticum aestivum]|uniref:Uncharacterized protein n=4 Tax=Triticum TaxID=4564 RepID=A0A9R1F8L6_WHEAT|nr:hypothetical protein TRIUR3_24190 [Triticum urartu]KAF7024178.1 hypothetical protein CFC21_036557 [Triticum aestivum]KAF7024184.1 hypothetical protein CFC21_036563 [Triticum aestivum]VAH64952.1 unnamed protein product [Triticum turgidum subsp. durum]